ncbi:MAG TPA: DNA topoisomerase IB [Acidisarcina sp.]
MQTLEIVSAPLESAKAAGLRYVTDKRPGLQRKRRGTGFRYTDADGSPVRDAATIKRIKSLAIPPAWTDVWICPIANGHLQATGRDSRHRKQSRYHPRWREVRDETKYERMALFGKALPKIRERVEHDLSLPGLPREKVLATIVRLLETTFIRVGNEEYARQNKSFGLTTMRTRHVDVEGSKIKFDFKGKSGVHHTIDVNDRRLARTVKRCLDLPGYELFQYLDSEGEPHTIDSADVNDYLREITNESFTAKDFRTWAGTVLAHMMLQEFEAFDSEAQAKKNVIRAIEAVAERLGNTPSVCRKCYVHPAVLESYLSGAAIEAVKQRVDREIAADAHALKEEELALMRLLQKRLAAA